MTYPELEFDYSVSPLWNATSPLTAKLTCIEVLRRRIVRLSDNEPSSLSYPDQHICQHSDFVPLLEPISSTNDSVFFDIVPGSYGATITSRPSKSINHRNFSTLSQTLQRFGVSDCSPILADIERASSSRYTGVIQVVIRKIETRVWKINDATEKSIIERECYKLADKSIQVFKYGSKEENGCVVCLEDYTQGSMVAKLACGHEFHGVCIEKWFLINHQCPMCRFPIPH